VEALLTILADWETASLFLRMSVAHALRGVEEAFELSLQLLQDPKEHPWLREVLAGDLIVWRERLPAGFVLTLLDDPTVTSAVVEALRDWPPETIPVDRLIPFCTHERKYLREVTIKTLMKTERRAPIAPILAALHDPEPEVRAAASHACMELVKWLPDQIPPDLMLQALSDEYAAVREDALDTLAQMPLRVPVEPIIAALDDPMPYVRCAAVEMLGVMGERVPSSAYSVLRQISGADESAHVRQRATRSLLLLAGMNPPPLRLPSLDPTLEEMEKWHNPEEWEN
jgi:HEAT repeat protein